MKIKLPYDKNAVPITTIRVFVFGNAKDSEIYDKIQRKATELYISDEIVKNVRQIVNNVTQRMDENEIHNYIEWCNEVLVIGPTDDIKEYIKYAEDLGKTIIYDSTI